MGRVKIYREQTLLGEGRPVEAAHAALEAEVGVGGWARALIHAECHPLGVLTPYPPRRFPVAGEARRYPGPGATRRAEGTLRRLQHTASNGVSPRVPR